MNDLETIKKRFPGISCAYRDIAGTVTTRCFGFADKEANVLNGIIQKTKRRDLFVENISI